MSNVYGRRDVSTYKICTRVTNRTWLEIEIKTGKQFPPLDGCTLWLFNSIIIIFGCSYPRHREIDKTGVNYYNNNNNNNGNVTRQ